MHLNPSSLDDLSLKVKDFIMNGAKWYEEKLKEYLPNYILKEIKGILIPVNNIQICIPVSE